MFLIQSDKWAGISKLMEECGEVVQVCAKLMQSRGERQHWSGDLVVMLQEELGDLLASIVFTGQHNPVIDQEAVAARAAMKLNRFEQWRAEEAK